MLTWIAAILTSVSRIWRDSLSRINHHIIPLVDSVTSLLVWKTTQHSELKQSWTVVSRAEVRHVKRFVAVSFLRTAFLHLRLTELSLALLTATWKPLLLWTCYLDVVYRLYFQTQSSSLFSRKLQNCEHLLKRVFPGLECWNL